MTSEERAGMRRRLARMDVPAVSGRGVGWLKPALVASLVLIAAAAYHWQWRPSEPPRGTAGSRATAATLQRDHGRQPTRQLRVFTKDGTQIIWILNDGLDL